MNKLAIALMAVCTPTALASDGLYAGIALGNVHAQAEVNRTATNGLTYTSNSGKNTAGVGAFVGFNHLIKETPFFIGLEAEAHSHDMNVTLNQGNGYLFGEKLTAQTKYSLSGVFKFGVSVNNLMIYAKVGAFKSQWRMSLEGYHPDVGSYSGMVKTNTYGSVYGFGADHKLNSNWGIGIDYAVKTSQSLSHQLCDWSTKIDPVISTTALRLTYTF